MFQLKPHPIEAETPDEDSQMFRLTTLGDLQAALGFSGSGPLYEFMLSKINSGIDRLAVQDYCDQFRAEVSLDDRPGKLWICKDPLAPLYLPRGSALSITSAIARGSFGHTAILSIPPQVSFLSADTSACRLRMVLTRNGRRK